jgi:hypothetical protein
MWPARALTQAGEGFYSGTVPDDQYGEAQVYVAVRLVRPLVIHDTIRGAEILDELMERTGAEYPGQAILASGYDGVVIHFGQDDLWVVAYRNDQVKVVVKGEEHD